MTSHIKIKLELNNANMIEVFEAHQGDKKSRFIDVMLTSNGEILQIGDGVTAKYDATINNIVVANDLTATVDITKNVVTVELTENMLSISGLLKIDLKILESESLITAQTLRVKIGKSVINSDSKFTPIGGTIQETIDEVAAARGNYDSLNNRINSKIDDVTGAVKTDNIAKNAVTSDKIIPGAITATKIAVGAVSGNNIAQGQINTGHLQSGAVTVDKFADEVKATINGKADKSTTYTKTEVNNALSSKLDNAEGSVTRDNIDTNAVGTDEIDSGAVDTVNIADRAVTVDKLSDNVNQELIINTLPKFMSLATVAASRAMHVDGQYLYHCGNSSYAVSKNDISVEVAPTQVKKIGGHAKVVTRGIAAGNGYLYVPYRDNISGTGTTHGSDDDVGGYLDIINLSDFTLAKTITYGREPYDPGDGKGVRYYGKSHNAATYADKYLCVTQQLGGWLLYDISTTPENPTLLYKCDNRAQSALDNTEFQQPAFYSDGITVYLAIAGYDRHLLKIYNLNDPTYPICVYSGDLRELWQHGDTAYLHAMGLVCKYPYIYCTVAPYPDYMADFDNTMQGVAVVDVSDINRVKVNFYKIPNESRTANVGGEPSPQSVAVTKNHLVMDMFDKGVSVWSLANPAEPKFLGNLDTGATKVCSVLSTEDGRTFIGTEYQGGNLTMYRGI